MPNGKFRIDPEFQSLLEPHSPEELAQLEENLLATRRCRDPIVVWKGRGIIVDGVNRYLICEKHGIPVPKIFMHFSSRAEAMQWILDNQLGRRNLSDAAKAKLRQARVERVAKLRAEGKSTTAIAKEVGIGQTQVRRDLGHAQVSPPANVVGLDGKRYVQNGRIPELAKIAFSPKIAPKIDALPPGKQRDLARLLSQGHGITTAYQMVMDQREPGDEPMRKPSTNGKPVLNWKGFTDPWGKVLRWIDDTARKAELMKSVLYNDLIELEEQFHNGVLRCFKQAEPAPSEDVA